jgi:hypothetical protein
MREIPGIRDALLRLSCIERMRFHYDPAGRVLGEGEIHYLVEVTGLFFVAWKNSDSGMMIVNPITRFGLDELEEVGTEEAWTALHVPAELSDSIQFREIDGNELIDVYRRMETRSLGGLALPPERYPYTDRFLPG